jgi:transcriptional regulator NrdR family protein
MDKILTEEQEADLIVKKLKTAPKKRSIDDEIFDLLAREIQEEIQEEINKEILRELLAKVRAPDGN